MMVLRSCPGLWSVAVAFALLAPGAAEAKDNELCGIVAQALLAIDPPGGGQERWRSPVRVLDKSSAGKVVIGAEGWSGQTKDEALDRLRREYRADPALMDAIGKFTSDGWMLLLQRFASSSLYMGKFVEGSASCERFIFFDAPPGGAAHPVFDPPVVRTAEPFAFCYRTRAYAGAVAGIPAFIVETDQDNVVELSLTPWRDGGWQDQCRVAVRFNSVFDAKERFCQGVDCQLMADQALALVGKVDEGPEAAEALANSQDRQFKAMKELADNDPRDIQRFPTFGAKIPGIDFVRFASDSVVLPVIVGGKTYLAHVGHLAIGWRTLPDYLFAAYKVAGHRLEPVAGLYITKTRDKPVSATAN